MALSSMLNDLSTAWAAAMWNSTLYGGCALLIAFIATRIGRLSGRWQCWLWRLALLKLFLAGLWLTPVELPWLPAQGGVAAKTDAHFEALHVASAPGVEVRAIDRSAAIRKTSANPSSTLTPWTWLLITWTIGVTCVAGRVVGKHRIVRRMASDSVHITDNRVHGRLRECCRDLRTARVPAIAVSPQLAGPGLVGILRPKILLPPGWQAWSDHQLAVALIHEVAHLKRRDLAWNWLATLAEVLYFYHPLVMIAKREWTLAQEIATDEMAVTTSRLNVAEYGQGLLAIVSMSAANATPLAASLGFSHRQLAKRLSALRTVRRAKLSWAMIAGIVAVAVLGLVPWKLTGRETGRPANEPPAPRPGAEEAQRLANDQREQAVDVLRNKGGKVRLFHDEQHPDHWIQIQLEGAAFSNDDMAAVSQLAQRSPTDLQLRDTLVTARGLRMLLGDRIRSLALSGKGMDDPSMQELRFFTKLRTLQIGETSITDEGVKALADCRSIETLSYGTDGLTDAALIHLRSLPALKKLSLGSSFGDSAATPINALEQLESLGLSANFTDAFLMQLDRLPELTELELSGSNVTDATAMILGQSAVNLKTLYLRHADLTDQGLRWISELSNLEVLALDHTKVGDDGVRPLAKLENLRWLDLSGAQAVTDRSLEVIGGLPKMRQLFLNGTQVTTEGLEHLRELENLRHLDLQATKVSSLPEWLESRPMLYISLD